MCSEEEGRVDLVRGLQALFHVFSVQVGHTNEHTHTVLSPLMANSVTADTEGTRPVLDNKNGWCTLASFSVYSNKKVENIVHFQ